MVRGGLSLIGEVSLGTSVGYKPRPLGRMAF